MTRASRSSTFASPVIGEKVGVDRRSDACFHGRMFHQPDAGLATVPINGHAAALALPPN